MSTFESIHLTSTKCQILKCNFSVYVFIVFIVIILSTLLPQVIKNRQLGSSKDQKWRRQRDPTPALLPENPWWAAVHGVAQSQTRLSDFTFTFHFHAWEKEMETHSSVLAWRIPGTGEPGGLLSMGSHRVGHD